MAGDWIKMRGSLVTNPKVIRMARFLAEDRCFQDWWTRGTQISCDDTVYEICDVTIVTRVTVGSLLAVWSAANECADKDGFIRGVTLFEVDEMAGVPSFGRALALVGWCVETDEGVQFPNFDEHNTVGKQRSSSAKTGAERTKEWRERKKDSTKTARDNGDVTVTSHGDHREEKRREEDVVDQQQPDNVVSLTPVNRTAFAQAVAVEYGKAYGVAAPPVPLMLVMDIAARADWYPACAEIGWWANYFALCWEDPFLTDRSDVKQPLGRKAATFRHLVSEKCIADMVARNQREVAHG